MKQVQKLILTLKKKIFLKDYQKSFNLDQSQLCISNGLEASALQREALFCQKTFFTYGLRI